MQCLLRALFAQLSDPGRLQSLGLVEVLDWTAAALDRVGRAAFFSRLNEDDMSIPDGLAAENVYVLDPCYRTGAYLAEVIRRISLNLGEQGLSALTGMAVKKAATERVFGFEIMPAPFVVAHLQVSLTLQNLDAPLADAGTERAGVFLTNAGWEARTNKPLLFPGLEEERDRADRVKQETSILVILGNPPYTGFAGLAVDEERELSDAYPPPGAYAGPKAKSSTISTCGSSAWRSDASRNRPAVG